MDITLLGTGSPVPMQNRASSGYLIEIGDEILVFDHGAVSGCGDCKQLVDQPTRRVLDEQGRATWVEFIKVLLAYGSRQFDRRAQQRSTALDVPGTKEFVRIVACF